MYQYGDYPESEEEYGEEVGEQEEVEEPLNKTYMDLMWQYLHHMLIPGSTLTNFRPDILYLANYDQLMTMIQHTIDPYLAVNVMDNQMISQEANQTAHRIRQDLWELGFSEIDPYSYINYRSVPYSNEPILLLNALGLLTSKSINAQWRVMLYPNEWKALVDAGLDLCEQVNGHPYFYRLIGDVESVYTSHLYELTDVERKLPHLPSYTADDLIDNLVPNKKCYDVNFDMRAIEDIYEEEGSKHQTVGNLDVDDIKYYERTHGTIPSHLESAISLIEERDNILYAIYEAITELEAIRQNVGVESKII